MTREKIMVDLFEFSAPTYYKWTKHQKRKIFDLLTYAFSEDELAEFLTTNKIQRIEKEKSYQLLEFSAIEFFKKLMNVTNFEMTKNILNLLKSNHKEDKLELDKFIEHLYLKDESFFIQNNPFSYNEKISLIKYNIVELVQKESFAVLDYICRNLVELFKETENLKKNEIFQIREIKIDDEIEINDFSDLD